MRRPLPDLVSPGHTALITQECQRAIIGPEAGLGELAAAARELALPSIVRLLAAARPAGVTVVHCLVERRADGRGSHHNARLFAAARNLSIEPGSPGTEVVDEIGVTDSDLVLTRLHGLGPMAGTDLDTILRNLGIRTVVPVGVSLNVAIPNLVMDAVNASYDVVLPRDAVAGVPQSYATDMIDHTLSLLATITTADDLVSAWT